MIARINFLVATAILVGIALLLAGLYLIATPIAALAPSWAGYVMSAWMLLSLALVVGIVAQIHGRLDQLYGDARRSPQRPIGFGGQALLYAGHALLLVGGYRWLQGTSGFEAEIAAVTLVVYAGGIAANLIDWRQRRTA